MIPSNVIHRVFRIRFCTQEGTAFAIDVDGREYLVTAKHVVQSISPTDHLEIFSNGQWKALPVKLVGHGEGDIDVSVLASDRILVPPGLPLEPAHDGVFYGQDVYFLGYPYGFCGKFIFGEDGYPLPFVKKATLSLFDGRCLFLDGHNNPGFSGGPVVFLKQPMTYCVAGVISGYRAVSEPVFANQSPTGLTYQHNTGIIVSYTIDTAVEIARSNPVGASSNNSTP